MMAQWKALSIWHRFGFLVGVMLVCLLGNHLFVWQQMSHSLEELQQEVAHLDQERHGLLQKTDSLKAIEREINVLREILSARIQQLPEHIESKVFRRDIMEIAKRRGVTVRGWKPEGLWTELQGAEASIRIAVRVEGEFEGTVQFLDDLRQLAWVESISSIVMAGRSENENSSTLITNLVMHGLTPLGIEHVQQLLKT
ncbi:MAG TPA: type 4a pilus biogenesis protein PilO [Nitrospirales bacterium]|nr:type 4a pilus biogenesis protein PilO [Nitrospirales bacterium]